MSTGVPAGDRDPYRKEAERTGWYGWIAFAGIMLCVLGIFHAMMGLVALFEEDYYAVGDSGLMLRSTTAAGDGRTSSWVLSSPSPESH